MKELAAQIEDAMERGDYQLALVLFRMFDTVLDYHKAETWKAHLARGEELAAPPRYNGARVECGHPA